MHRRVPADHCVIIHRAFSFHSSFTELPSSADSVSDFALQVWGLLAASTPAPAAARRAGLPLPSVVSSAAASASGRWRRASAAAVAASASAVPTSAGAAAAAAGAAPAWRAASAEVATITEGTTTIEVSASTALATVVGIHAAEVSRSLAAALAVSSIVQTSHGVSGHLHGAEASRGEAGLE
eukprot:CAMPEP_0195020540 /NCGR_PEP_ID=MMETSP0326_2-20130528/35553_1 /TAXON_ID=2866 ORGANISM="Crypthecodinium cohnii, Strain Seligo" /NCGR_SAMPLE_ID=MMETSP0326_2 /ASSEMBLY_ACC=CAM_ASM_000348 /LENGTH=181 /DNA_ID=CAMNT_0040039253 /DNA_START=225 /DNA_END=768 /DNA_ORIENTATION=+